ncbi:MAG TPA: ABC transporter permease [Acidimicrobiales bacterium]|jgi:sulfonate transport system permease protein
MTSTYTPAEVDASASASPDDRLLPGLVAPRFRRRRKRNPLVSIALRVISILVVLLLWWLEAKHIGDPEKLPSPLVVYHNFGFLFSQKDLLGQIGISLTRSVKGLVIGASCGFALGAVSGLTSTGEGLIDSPMQLIRFTPFLALIPLFITWFGLSDKPKIILISLACATPVYLNTATAVRNVDRRVVEAARSFGLKKLRLLREVTFPLALPGILTGLRFSMAVSVLALVAAEQINANSGIGAMMLTAQGNLNTQTVFCCVVLYMGIGICFDAIIRIVEVLSLRWRAGVSVR